MNELYHHGVKGQKWGVRRYQYADGSLTPAGAKRYSKPSNNYDRISIMMSTKVTTIINNAKTQVTGKQYVDTYLRKGTTFSRIQTSQEFENFAFYATYKKQDSDKYMGLFGKNLTSRAAAEAKYAEKKAKETGSEENILTAKALRDKADGMKVYQLKIESTAKLKVPSDENAGHITANLLKEKEKGERIWHYQTQPSRNTMACFEMP